MNKQISDNTTCIKLTPAYAKAGRTSRMFATALILISCLLVSNVYANPSSAQYKEYEVKAAFIFNFLKFVDWPEAKMAGNNQIIVGIIGEDPFGSAADLFKGKEIENRQLVVKRFEGLEQLKKLAEKEKNERLEAVKSCHLLFICPSEQKQIKEIIDIVDKHGVLTVGDAEGFVESGGIINFFTENNKIRFDINQAAAEKTGLKIRSQLLRLARKVVKDNEPNTVNAQNTTKQEGN